MNDRKGPGADISLSNAGPERMAAVLERLAFSRSPLSHSELSSALGIAKSTLTNLLGALRKIGYVDVVEKRYVLGPRLLALAHQLAPHTLHHERMREKLLPVLKILAESTGETASLLIELNPNSPPPAWLLPIAYVESHNRIRYVPSDTMGAYPMGVTAAGRVLLAFSGRSARGQITYEPAFVEDEGPRDEKSLDEALLSIRNAGYAINTTSAEHWITIAAPVLNSRHEPVAAISVIGPSFRMAPVEEIIWPSLKEATNMASALIREQVV